MNKNELSKKKKERMASIQLALLFVLVILFASVIFLSPSGQMLVMEIILIMGVILGIMAIIEGIRLYSKKNKKKQLASHLIFAGLMFLMPVLFILV